MLKPDTYFIQKTDFIDFLKDLSSEFRAFYLRDDKTKFYWKEGQRKILFWQEYKGSFDGLMLAEVRAQDPLKQFVFSSKEKVAQNFDAFEKKEEKPILLIGAKNCDLSGLDVTDFVFMQGDFKDPFYIGRRESLFIIASDCSNPIETCFCLALGKNPSPEKNYDMAVADIQEGYVVEVASERAKNYISKHKDKFVSVTTSQLQKREGSRNDTIRQLEVNIKNNEIPRKDQLGGIIETGFDSNIWQDEIKTCVECGCCNVICPTCHCFFLSDSKDKNNNIRYKAWDACLYKDFAVVAGGANPRKRLFQRLRNRYEKKFSYFPNIAGIIACTGCGRCITGCPAKIDIRRILKNLVKVKASA